MKSPHRKKIMVLGSTGSIGQNCLDVIRMHPENFSAYYLTAHQNVDLLVQQAQEFKPYGIVITDPQFYPSAKEALRGLCEVREGPEGLLNVLEDSQTDLVVNALVGGAGVLPTYQALKNGRNVALANKESLVVAGQQIMELVKGGRGWLFPVDSEHSAIFQCMVGENPKSVRRIILTGSGGPFRNWPAAKLKNVTVEQALHHPNWNMGQKITIDSATLMNKGLEVIEAHWLYGISPDQIEVVIHPQSIIHSLVEFHDGSVKAQLGMPDMRLPIQYALTYPERLPLQSDFLSLEKIGQLTFEPPDYSRFPALNIATEALRQGGNQPAVLNAANESAVQRFLRGNIPFLHITAIIQKTLDAYPIRNISRIEDILEDHERAKEYAFKIKT
jgi:1-deoxy-D-xylulose-5-phosphate reductoisomerase